MENVKDLRLIAYVPHFGTTDRRPRLLRFRCMTCERDSDFYALDKADLARMGDEWKLDNANPVALDGVVPSGHYPLIEFDKHGRCAVVLPFDFRKWQGHLLHDVRPEWDGQFICRRGVHVQEWPEREGARTIELVGAAWRDRRAPTGRLCDIDISKLRRNALIRVLSTEQYFRWLPESMLVADGVLTVHLSRLPDVGRFVLDAQAWSPADADLEVEAL